MTASGLRVVVMGGSLGGLNAALWLRDIGCEVTVYERSPIPLSGLGAGIVLHPSTVRYFTEHGLVDLEKITVPSHRVRYLDREGAVADEKPMSYLFSSYDSLYRGFHGASDEEKYHLGVGVDGFDPDGDGVDVSLSDGDTVRCDLLVCADGIRSEARGRLVPEARLKYAGYVAWRGTARAEDLASETYGAFHEAMTYHVMEGGHMLTYPIPASGRPGEDGRPYINWLIYTNVPEGPELDDLMTDVDGERRAVSLHPGIVQEKHLERLRREISPTLPPVLREVVLGTEEPFVQAILDSEVPRMAFGRVCMIGDAAFAARPHAAVGTAKAAENGWSLSRELARSGGDVASALEAWEPGQLELGRSVLARTREAGERSQFSNSWRVGDPLPFGLHEVGDSSMSL